MLKDEQIYSEPLSSASTENKVPQSAVGSAHLPEVPAELVCIPSGECLPQSNCSPSTPESELRRCSAQEGGMPDCQIAKGCSDPGNRFIYSTCDSVQGSVILHQTGYCHHAEGKNPKKELFQLRPVTESGNIYVPPHGLNLLVRLLPSSRPC